MTTTYEWLPVDEITRQARQVTPGRTMLTWIGAVLFALGWVVHKVFTVAWFVAAWAFVAVREGWREAGKARVSRGAG